MPTPIDGGTCLVTGASSGIGREIARQLAPRAAALVLVARRRDRLDALKEELVRARPDLRVHVEVRDLADPSACAALVESVRAAVGHVDVLVNNAGVGDMGMFDLADAERTRRMIELNVTSLVMLTRAFVAGMVERGRGGILNVSSGFGIGFLPGFATYVGTKHFVTGFTEALRADLAGTGVVVTQVCPGPVATEFEENVGNFTGEKVPAFIEISADRCARAAIRGLDRRRAMVIPGLLIRAVLFLSDASPRFLRRLFANVVGRMLRKRQLAALRAAEKASG